MKCFGYAEEITSSGELPIGSEIKFLQVYARPITNIAEVRVAAVNHTDLSHLLILIQLLLLLVSSIILLLAILVLTLILVILITLLCYIVTLETQSLMGFVIAELERWYMRYS